MTPASKYASSRNDKTDNFQMKEGGESHAGIKHVDRRLKFKNVLPVRCAVVPTPLRRDRARVFHLSASLINSLHICAHNVRNSIVCLRAEPYGFDRDEEDEFLYGPSTTSAPGKQRFPSIRFSEPHEIPLFLVSSSITLTIPTDANDMFTRCLQPHHRE